MPCSHWPFQGIVSAGHPLTLPWDAQCKTPTDHSRESVAYRINAHPLNKKITSHNFAHQEQNYGIFWVVYPLLSISGTCWLQPGGPRCSKVWFLMDFGSRLGSLWGHFSAIFWKNGLPFCKQFYRSLLEGLRGSFWSPKSDRKVCFSGVLDMLQT